MTKKKKLKKSFPQKKQQKSNYKDFSSLERNENKHTEKRKSKYQLFVLIFLELLVAEALKGRRIFNRVMTFFKIHHKYKFGNDWVLKDRLAR